MKVKMKFDKQVLLGFVVDYGERALFACVVLVFLFFIYKSFTGERYEKTPQDLEKAARNASEAIERTAEPNIEGQEITDYLKTIEELSDPDEEHYATKIPLNPPVFTPRSKRGEPELYTVMKLRGTPGVGQFEKSLGGGMGGMGMGAAGMGAGGAAAGQNMGPLGSRWVMLTGLVDLKKQTKAFYECYKDAVFKNPQLDQAPTYYAFWVERAEVGDDENAEELKWEQPYQSLRMEIDKCGVANSMGGSDGYVDPLFIHNRIVFPLPRRIDQDWDESVAHPPEIPLLSEDYNNLKNPGDIKAEEERPLEDPDDPGAALDRGRAGMGVGRGMAGGMEMGMGPGMGMRPGMGMPGMEGGMMGGRLDRTGRRGGIAQGQTAEELSPYILFRFIDFNVQPGKRYKYRVRLGFYNPNYGVESRYLISELQQIIAEDKEREPHQKKWKKYIKSPWSEPSDVVAVPHDDQLLLVSIDPARKVDSEPEAKVMAVHWDMQNGVKVSADFDNIRRGMVANFLGHKVENLGQRPGAARGGPGMMGPGMMGPGMMGPGNNDRKKDARNATKSRKKPAQDGLLGGMGGRQNFGGNQDGPRTVDFKTECLVLDLRGGEPLNRELSAPGEILLLDPEGNVVVRSDVDDFDEYRNQKLPPKQSNRMPGGRRGGMGGPGMMGEGMLTPGMGF